jgi:hypothetical protein
MVRLLFALAVRALDLFNDGVCHINRLCLAAQVGSDNTLLTYPLGGVQKLLGCIRLTQPLEHLGARPEGCYGVGYTLARNVESRSVDRLEHAGVLASGVQVGGGSNTNRAGQGSGQVRQDIGVQVGGDNGVKGLGLEDHAARHGVDEHLVLGDVGEVLGDLGGDLVPEHHTVALGVALGDDGQQLARALLRRLKGEADDALHGVAGEDGHLGRRLPGLAAVRPAALAGVLALAVLADDDPVQVARRAVAQGRLRAAEDLGGSHVGVLLEGLANGQSETPEGNVVRNV